MKQLQILLLVSLLLLFFAGTSFAEEMVFDPVQDAFTNSVMAWVPLGLANYLNVGWELGGAENILFLEFDLDELPDGTVIDQADLELTVSYGEQSFEMDGYIIDFAWDEATITYENQPDVVGYFTTWIGDASWGTTIAIPIPTSTAMNWMEYPDITYGIGWKSPNPVDEEWIRFFSKEHPSEPGPKLRVTYHANPPAEMTITPEALSGEYDFGDPSFDDPGYDFEYSLESSGEGYLFFTAICDVDWMHITTSGGRLPAGETYNGVIVLDYWPGPGTHVGNLIFSDPNAVPPVDSLAVTLICHQAQLAVDPGTVDLTWSSFDPDASSSFEVQNPGDLTLDWSLTETADWMVCTPANGTVDSGSSQTITVTTDSWPGEGTFNETITITDDNADPVEATVDVTLTCIDAPLLLTLYPPTDPVVVQPGGSFEYDLQLDSWLDVLTYTDFLVKAVLPNGNSITITTVMNVPVQPNATLYVDGLSQTVPVTAPIGNYVFRVLAGVFPNQLLALDSFGVTVQGAALSGGAEDWLAGGFDETLAGYLSEPTQSAVVDSEIPSEFALGQAYPNPFNPSTTLSVSLPEASVLNVSIYNVNGQHVASLAKGNYVAGSHTLTFDASHLSGGIYFVQATAGSWNDVQKVVLMK
jgi:Secretion system C-terminal sorting domain/Viral BACON domain